MANRGTSVDGGWKLVSFGLVCFQVVLAYEVWCYVSVQVTYLLDIKFSIELKASQMDDKNPNC